MNKFLLFLTIITLSFLQTKAATPREGMWLPFLLQNGQIAEMQDMGLKLTAEDIYSVNQSSLKDAIVNFGGYCTGSVISSQGLLLTNHHCGSRSIQRHSTLENDLLKDGFWAGSMEEELRNKNLKATFVERMEDVTNEVLDEEMEEMSFSEKSSKIQEKIKEIANEATDGKNFLSAEVKSFYGGNQYILIVRKTYQDVRLVGAPPESIGAFGGDTDNWVWPRHTGDFSFFRIYADSNNQPAPYSETNQPYQAPHHLKIDKSGVESGDFTMVFGFPARTDQYLTSHAVDYEINKSLPAKVKLRTRRLEVMDRYIRDNDTIRLMYTDKQSTTANAWKKWKGMIKGLKTVRTLNKKRQFEQTFQNAVNRDDRHEYRDLLTNFEATYERYLPYDLARDYLLEAGLGLELVKFANRFRKLVSLSALGKNADKAQIQEEAQTMIKRTQNFHENYYKPIDREIFPKLLEAYANDVDTAYRPEIFDMIEQKYDNDFHAYTDYVFEKSLLDDEEALIRFLKKFKVKDGKKLQKDPAYQLMSSMINGYLAEVRPQWSKHRNTLDSLYQLYIKAQLQLFPDATHYPDANFSLRLTYGKVQGYEPSDAVHYDYQTYLDGIMEKNFTGEEDYVMPDALKTLYHNKDYGTYGEDGKMPVCFIAANHTSGGNSGSPVLNAKGELIGLNFDRNWEGTMSDINYDERLCRNISVDIRYILFITDKMAGADRLVEEMELN